MIKEKIKIRIPSLTPIKSGLAPRRIIKYRVRKLTLFVSVYLILIVSLTTLYISTSPKDRTQRTGRTLGDKTSNLKSNKVASIEEYKIPTHTPIPPTPIDIPPTNIPIPTATIVEEQTTKTITNVKNDESMANASEIFNALNSYRREAGVPNLSRDNTLTELAGTRASTFLSNGSLDDHAGFRNYMDNGGFEMSGFNGLGENSAQLPGPMHGDRIIKELFGASPSHNSSQLDPSWTHVGVAINGIFVNINFGKNKM